MDGRLRRAWLAQLHRDWQAINSERLDGALRPPVLGLDERTRRLGSWHGPTRTLTISAEHLRGATWAEVRLTLTHEMAHQVVWELYDAPDAPPHGQLFERACRQLGLELEGPRSPRTASRSDRILDKVKKLFNLARSPNVHEAQAAMAAANRLLLEHNLERLDLPAEGYGFRWLGRPLSRIPLEHKLLASLLGEFFFVRAIWVGTRRAADDKPVSLLEVVGRAHNLEVAAYVHATVVSALERLWLAHRDTLPVGRARRARHDYRVGVVLGFREHLRRQSESTQSEGLIWRGDAALDELFGRRFPRQVSLRGGYYRTGAAHQAGRRDGRRLRIRPGVQDTPRRRGRLLD